MIRFLCIGILLLVASFSWSQNSYRSFEVRYFSDDQRANGETDFKGETSVFSNEDRLQFLNYYAEQASAYYGDKKLDNEVVSDAEIDTLLKTFKKRPSPTVRRQIELDNWKYISTQPGDDVRREWELNQYIGTDGLALNGGYLSFDKANTWLWRFGVQTWRFDLSWKVRFAEANKKTSFVLKCNADDSAFVKLTYEDAAIRIYSANKVVKQIPCKGNEWHSFKIEGDMVEEEGRKHFNFYMDDVLLGDYLVAQTDVDQVDGFQIESEGGLLIDNIVGMGYHKNSDIGRPFYNATFLDEHFSRIPSLENWYSSSYQDAEWKSCNLPMSQGGERFKGKDLYFRKTVKVGHFDRAHLNLEVLDPSGEVWINNQLVTKVNDRYPVKLDVTKFLKENEENLIAIKVNYFYLNRREGVGISHTPLDLNFSWFLGRANLELTDKTFVDDIFLYTKELRGKDARMQSILSVNNTRTLGFNGSICIQIEPWNFEGQSYRFSKELLIGVGVKKFGIPLTIDSAMLWEPDSPNLYKVTVSLKDKEGKVVDDYVTTTGIRTLSQEGGQFRLNGKPFMLNGTQIMGFRAPFEKMSAWLRCPPTKWVAKEMLMTRKMGCNMLRIHVHGWKEKAVGINDPRYPEMADQMGIMLISAPPAWIREGDWGQIDFDGYHKYMRQVQNHPSIVMWELGNHPNTFGRNEGYESDLFSEDGFNSIYPYDPSRLISLTSHIAHLRYGNDLGTLDKKKNAIEKKKVTVELLGNQGALSDTDGQGVLNKKISKYWTAPMITRGNQDAPTGYGSEWSVLRKWPNAYVKDFLNSKDRAYFNFEHQESIGQPNWSLCKGKPWYKLQSYEWGYDKGSIGRLLDVTEWRESQAWQAFSGYEAIKKMRFLDYDGFSWCSLHGGANSATYNKPAIDYLGHAKLIYYINRTLFQPTVAGSDNVDVVYGPGDAITPVILHYSETKKVNLTVLVKKEYDGETITRKEYHNILLKSGRGSKTLPPFKPEIKEKGLYFVEYIIEE